MRTHPNQKIITIHRPVYEKNFLSVGREDWHRVAALDSNSRAPLVLYLYLMDNENNFNKGFSPADMVELFGMSKKTWERAMQVLIDNGFVVHNNNEPNNRFHFHHKPQENKKSDINLECNFKEFLALDEEGQEQRYNKVIDKEWDDMNDDDRLIHDYYLKYVIEGE